MNRLFRNRRPGPSDYAGLAVFVLIWFGALALVFLR